MQLSLGSLLFFWDRERVYNFYRDMIEQPVDIIYLGESVCSKRRELKTAEWIELGQELAQSGKEPGKAAGKQIVLSSLALIEAESELKTLRRLCDNGELMIEANDIGAVQLMAERKLPFVAGTSINIYNARTLKNLYDNGMRRWVMPVELSGKALADILTDAQSMGIDGELETEVFSYGLMPLAYSARCFTARARNLPKDRCQYVCLEYPDGLPMSSQEDQEVFTINGIQTLSGQTYNLLPELDEMKRIGVDIVRLSPQGEEMASVIKQFRDQLDGNSNQIPIIPQDAVNGYWYDDAGLVNTHQS
ncbi:U32 family peptidase [Motiliproteus coralliicola]|uniref:Ubiquinone biosynthesis protein UbiV n=1 Tax=Motiliproteus coralliicola TaxID=2283196 RepID=A0A369WF04_9GAMM|nr:U32 family peptidase [Motiliproteus coralliicola]RDE18045.1 U32 family peptidase [Motiliproteus coralliicola]